MPTRDVMESDFIITVAGACNCVCICRLRTIEDHKGTEEPRPLATSDDDCPFRYLDIINPATVLFEGTRAPKVLQ